MRTKQQIKHTLLTVIGVAIILALLALLALSGGNLDLLKNIFSKVIPVLWRQLTIQRQVNMCMYM